MEPAGVIMKEPMAYSHTDVALHMAPTPAATVVTNQPTTTIINLGQNSFLYPRGIPRDWSTPLCGCFEDCAGCLCAFFFFPCYECHVATKMGENCCTPICVPNGTMVMRAHIRGRHNIQGTLINDCCTAAFCSQCALAQLSREIDNIKGGRAAP
ncbi:placenta-specific gene 8 protein-like [Acanthaster planci]|uniref:Placenta-specific gene 8 protein-like n=1 Tax=Acanthaster planci TaxID=133434 RepID=A0A8B7XPP8_ACAPL|nr:placenta-specific gene 8 protein-like [Acanthaster planci]